MIETPIVNYLTFQVWDSLAGSWVDLKTTATAVDIRRGGQQNGAAPQMQVGTLDATLFGDIDLRLTNSLKPNSPIRVLRKADGNPEFTGTIQDVSQAVDYDKARNVKNVYTNLAAVDAVQSLANTDRYGVSAPSGVGFQSWTDRLRTLYSSSMVSWNVPDSSNTTAYLWGGPGLDDWTGQIVFGAANSAGQAQNLIQVTPDAGPSIRTRVTRINNVQTQQNFAPTFYREFRNLVPGTTYNYTVTLKFTESVNFTPGDFVLQYKSGSDVQKSDPFNLPDLGDTLTIGFQFTPASTVGVIGVYGNVLSVFAAGAGNQAMAWQATNLRLTVVGDPQGLQLQDVAYESSLVNHVDLACNSVGARWYVRKDGVVEFIRTPSTGSPVLAFSDVAGADISYTDVALSYDTKNVVNSLKMNQHGLDPATGNAVDYSDTFTADSSVRRWGVRSSDMDTCLYVGGIHSTDLMRRASMVMSGLSRPNYAVSSLTINVQSNPAVLAALELCAPVTITYGQLVQTARVLSLAHTITPTRWLVTVTFNDVRSGATYADFAQRFSGTFADWNTAHAGKSFQAINVNPLI